MRELRIRNLDLESKSISRIVQELDRIGRDREQYRHNNSSGFMYVAFIKKVDDVTFIGHIGGPDTNQDLRVVPLSIKFKVTQNEIGQEQITIGPRDKQTTYEQAMLLIKHAINKHLRELPNKPYVFDDGINKDNWNGYYFSYSGVHNKIRADFDEIFDRAVTEGYLPESLRETFREYGFNITPQPWNRGLTNTELLQAQSG